MAERFEYGRKVDCALNDCPWPHSDDGCVFEWPSREFGPPDLTVAPVVNGHACRWVRREIPDWEPIP